MDSHELLLRYRSSFTPVHLYVHKSNHVRICFHDIIAFGQKLRGDFPDSDSVAKIVQSMQSEARKTHVHGWMLFARNRFLCGHDIDMSTTLDQDELLFFKSPYDVNLALEMYRKSYESIGLESQPLTVVALDKVKAPILWLRTGEKLVIETLCDRFGNDDDQD